LRSAGPEANQKLSCVYESESGDTLTYETGCGNVFRLDPVLELYEFCPYCGKRVALKARWEPSAPTDPLEAWCDPDLLVKHCACPGGLAEHLKDCFYVR
jgi:DNA-directed RNA polymerase subunit RPC12/RpoP